MGIGLPRIEARSINYVPLAERHGKVWHLWPVWFSGNAQLATLALGALGITVGGNLLWSGIAVLAGCVVGTFFMAFHAAQGPRLGLPQMIQSRPQFGYRGANLVWVVALIAYIGYNALNQVLAAQALHEVNGAISATSAGVIVLFALLAMGLALVGYDKIHLAQRGVAYLMIAILTVFSVEVLLCVRLPPAQWQWSGFRVVPFLTEFSAAASYQLTWSIYVSDYSRYLPRDVGVRASFWWTYLGAFVGGAWMMLVGTVAAAIAPTLGAVAAIKHAADALFHGFGDVLLMSGVLGLITISALNFYGASLTLLSMADTVRPLRGTLQERAASLGVALLVTIGLALDASGSFVARYNDLLALLLYLFTPWTAINLIDFYVVREGHYSVREIFNSRGMYGTWNWRGITAYLVGFLAMIPFFSTGLYTGPVARALDGADIAMFVGLPVAAAVYMLACRSMDFERDRRQAAEADRGLDPDETAVA
jgi:NCS1 family nucleobase:cation symporter-1